jgi:putative ABC transport system permease protein
MTVSKFVYEQKYKKMIPTSLLTSSPAAEVDHYPGVKKVQFKEQLIDSFNTILETMQMMIAIIILAAVILGTVVLYNLGALAFTEKTRELATLRVLGFSNQKIEALSQKQNIWITVAGILVGVPFGYGLILFMLQTMSDSSDFSIYISPLTYIMCAFFTLVLSVCVNILMSRKIKTIDMVSALKSVE